MTSLVISSVEQQPEEAQMCFNQEAGDSSICHMVNISERSSNSNSNSNSAISPTNLECNASTASNDSNSSGGSLMSVSLGKDVYFDECKRFVSIFIEIYHY